jgi:hypothetical protein
MKNIVLLGLTIFVIVSCSHREKAPDSQVRPVSSTENKKILKTPGKTRAVFHIIEPLNVEIALFNIETKREETVLVDKTLSQLELGPGHWQVRGFILAGTRYNITNSAKQFIFKLKKDKMTYVGSYIFQCPKVNQTYLKDMKKMSFFNRYPFSSKNSLCEVVVGSDFKKVNKVWVALDKEKHQALSLGF